MPFFLKNVFNVYYFSERERETRSVNRGGTKRGRQKTEAGSVKSDAQLTGPSRCPYAILLLKALQWLPVVPRVKPKVLMLAYKALHDLAPPDLLSSISCPSPFHYPWPTHTALFSFHTPNSFPSLGRAWSAHPPLPVWVTPHLSGLFLHKSFPGFPAQATILSCAPCLRS